MDPRMGRCSICKRISAGGDHLDCTEKRRLETEDESFKEGIPERLDLAKNSDNLAGEIRAILDHMTGETTGPANPRKKH